MGQQEEAELEEEEVLAETHDERQVRLKSEARAYALKKVVVVEPPPVTNKTKTTTTGNGNYDNPNDGDYKEEQQEYDNNDDEGEQVIMCGNSTKWTGIERKKIALALARYGMNIDRKKLAALIPTRTVASVVSYAGRHYNKLLKEVEQHKAKDDSNNGSSHNNDEDDEDDEELVF